MPPEEKPRTVPRFLSCLVKGPLGCLAFVLGAGVVTVLFLPPVGGRLVDRGLVEWFGENYQGKLELGDAWLGSVYGPQHIESLILRDPAGDEVLRAELRAPSLSQLFDGRYGPVEVRVESLDLVEGRDGVTNLARALAPRATAPRTTGPPEPEEPRRRGARQGFQTDQDLEVALTLVIERLRYSDGNGHEGVLDNLALSGTLSWGPDETRLELAGGEDQRAPEPLAVELALARSEGRAPGPWSLRWSVTHAPTRLVSLLCGNGAVLERFCGSRIDGLRWSEPEGGVALALEDEGAQLALVAEALDGEHVLRGSAEHFAELRVPVREPWIDGLIVPLLPPLHALLPDPTREQALLRLEDFRWPLGAPVSELSGELTLALAFDGFELEPSFVERLDRRNALPRPGELSQLLHLEKGMAAFSDLALPLEQGHLSVAGTLDLTRDQYDLRATVDDGGVTTDLGRLQGPRNALAPAPPQPPPLPVPTEPGVPVPTPPDESPDEPDGG